MKIKTEFVCDKCEMSFHSEGICKEHEQYCNPVESFTCYKCGDHREWHVSDKKSANINRESCHCIVLGRMGYGSSLEGCNVNFGLCDKCLVDLVDNFTPKGKESVYNSRNYFLYDYNNTNTPVDM